MSMRAGASTAKKSGDLEDTLQTSRNADLKPSALFFIWFAANLTIGDFAIGFIPIAMGVPLNLIVLALVTGNVTGGALLSYMSILGVRTRKMQMAQSFGPFGSLGSKVMALLQWGNTLGWLTVNLVLASFAILVIFRSLYFVVPIVGIAVIVFSLAYFGHRAIKSFETVMAIVLGIMFAAITVEWVLHPSGITLYSPTLGTGSFVGFGITVAASFSYIMSWGPYASDYSRFVTRKHQKRTFAMVFAGSVIASFWVEMLGVVIGISTLSYVISSNFNPAMALAKYLGPYFVLGMMALFLGGLAANSINLYSNSSSIMVISDRVKRNVGLLIGSAASVSLGIIGYASFYSFYETFLYMLDYWITPWLAILIIHYFIVARWNISGIHGKKYTGMVSYLLAILISVPFMSQAPYYVGPIARIFGGVDISYYVSFVVAAVLYISLNRKERIYAETVKTEGLS